MTRTRSPGLERAIEMLNGKTTAAMPQQLQPNNQDRTSRQLRKDEDDESCKLTSLKLSEQSQSDPPAIVRADTRSADSYRASSATGGLSIRAACHRLPYETKTPQGSVWSWARGAA